MGGASGAPRLLTINFISEKSSKYVGKHVKKYKNMQKYTKYGRGGGLLITPGG